MARLTCQARLGWFALGAIVAMLSLSEGASADGAATGRDKNCCVARPMADCSCCEAAPSDVGFPIGAGPVAGVPALRRCATPCICRGDVPVPPASKSEPTAPERRHPGERAEAAGLAHLAGERSAPVRSHLASPGGGLPSSRRYLSTSRFRC